LASLLEDQKKESLKAMRQQEELIQREKEELEKAIEESSSLYLRFAVVCELVIFNSDVFLDLFKICRVSFLMIREQETLRLKALLEKIKTEEVMDPSKVYYTCKITLVDGSQYERNVISTGTFEQLSDYVETRSVDPELNQEVSVPKQFVLLSDYPRTIYLRDQVIENSGIHLNKKLGMLMSCFP
jgi:hypothetical protein